MSDSERRARWGWILPLVFLSVASVLYARVALVHAIPRVVPALLERSITTETELTRTFRAAITAVSVALPPLILFSLTAIIWGLVRWSGVRAGFSGIFTLVARASLFATAGLLVKTLLVLSTKTPDPPVNLGFWIQGGTPVRAALLALTNPFGLATIAATIHQLRAIGLSWERAAFAGAAPWAIGLMLFAQSSGSGGLVPEARSVTEGWATKTGGATVIRYPTSLRAAAFAEALDSFAGRLQAKLGEPTPTIEVPSSVRIDIFSDHSSLERATGEALPVEVTGSIRGRDLLYLEMPGRSPAVPEARALEDAARYVAVMLLAPRMVDAPRWFVEGLAHAESIPYSQDVDRDYLSALRRFGLPSLSILDDPRLYRTKEGPLLARAFVDHIAYRHGGRATIDGMTRDLLAGTPFRDSLFERTRLTMSALETEWVESIRTILVRADSASADSAR